MPDQRHNLPKQLRFGQGKQSREAKPPEGTGAGGRINTSFQDIKWTPRKLTVTTALLSIPFLIAVIISFAVGNNLIGFVFLSLGAFVVGMYLLLRYIERADL